MRPNKSRRAILMAGVAGLSTLGTMACWEAARLPGGLGELAGERLEFSLWQVLGLLAVVALLCLMLFLPFAFVIHNWDESHFGREGALRWVLFGIVLGSLAQLRHFVPWGGVKAGFGSFFLEQLLSLALGFAMYSSAYFVAFKLVKRRP
ncbi:MAG: hypothetical protein HY869_16280 [Chloroflexi bacterium]|nr:hypothetical protein [Chloroflexota bacterium]